MIQEASLKEQAEESKSGFNGGDMSRISNTNPITRQSLANLVGENENDLLADTPVFQRAQGVGVEINPKDVIGRATGGASSVSAAAAASASNQVQDQDVEDKIDDKLMKEIEDYLEGVMTNNEQIIDMADNVIRSDGAKCVAAALEFCSQLVEVRLSNCQIKDVGAKALFGFCEKNATVQIIDLSNNPITEKSFEAIDKMLTNNSAI